MSQNEKNNEPMNESILNPQISQDLKKERTDHMAYLPIWRYWIHKSAGRSCPL